MSHSTLCGAIRAKRCVELRYDGYKRLVEIHAYGATQKGHAIMLIWQVSGGSAHNEPTGWKMLRLDEASGVHLADEASRVPRPGYKRDDRAMLEIYCQV
jgi:hypothetical protein